VLDGLGKANTIISLEEIKDVAAFFAAETMEKLPPLVHRKRRGLIEMVGIGAAAHEAPAAAAQLGVLGNDLADAARVADFFDKILAETHG
jgi:hypothetical protein